MFRYHNELSVKITFRGIFHIRIDASGALIEYLFVSLYVVVTGITVISLLTSRMFPVTVKILVTYVHANDHVIECEKILVSFGYVIKCVKHITGYLLGSNLCTGYLLGSNL